MKKLLTFLHHRMHELHFENVKNFVTSKEVVYSKEDNSFLHTFNYLGQDNYLEIDTLCENFNQLFESESNLNLSSIQKEWLAQNGFSIYIEKEKLHFFSAETLDTDFYPFLQGYYIRHDNNDCYMLLSIHSYEGTPS